MWLRPGRFGEGLQSDEDETYMLTVDDVQVIVDVLHYGRAEQEQYETGVSINRLVGWVEDEEDGMTRVYAVEGNR